MITLKQRLWAQEASRCIGIGQMDIAKKGFALAIEHEVSPLVAACSLYGGGLAIHVKSDRGRWNLEYGQSMAERVLAKHPHLADLTLDDLRAPAEEIHVVSVHRMDDGQHSTSVMLETSDHNAARQMYLAPLFARTSPEPLNEIYSLRTDIVVAGRRELLHEECMSEDGTEFPSLQAALASLTPLATPKI